METFYKIIFCFLQILIRKVQIPIIEPRADYFPILAHPNVNQRQFHQSFSSFYTLVDRV